jgi:hypothetical protein
LEVHAAKLCEQPGGQLIVACEGCVTRVEEEGDYVGFRGAPEIRERLVSIDANLRRMKLPCT